MGKLHNPIPVFNFIKAATFFIALCLETATTVKCRYVRIQHFQKQEEQIKHITISFVIRSLETTKRMNKNAHQQIQI